jgi:hypothetical protein
MNVLKIIYRPPFQVQDPKPEHEAMRYTFVKQIQDWRRAGIIKNLIFSDESRFCRGRDNFWVRVRRGAWNETATITRWKFPLGVVVCLRCNRGGIQESDHSLFEGVNSAEYVGMVL